MNHLSMVVISTHGDTALAAPSSTRTCVRRHSSALALDRPYDPIEQQFNSGAREQLGTIR
jgi:hypothetical protein